MSSDRGRKEMAAGTSLFCNAYFHSFHFISETQAGRFADSRLSTLFPSVLAHLRTVSINLPLCYCAQTPALW